MLHVFMYHNTMPYQQLNFEDFCVKQFPFGKKTYIKDHSAVFIILWPWCLIEYTFVGHGIIYDNSNKYDTFSR